MTLTNVTAAQARAGLVYGDGYKWAGSTITYSIPGAGAVWASGYGRGEVTNSQYGTLNATQAAGFVSAIEIWDSYIRPSMNKVSDATPGQIRAAFTDASGIEGNSFVGAYAYSPPFPGSTALPQSGDVWIDESLKGSTFAQRSQSFELLLHELGHSLGLKHPFDDPTLPAGYDSKIYTVMSYTNADYFYTFSGGGGSIGYSVTGTVAFTPMVLDILAIQEHYGADTQTNLGNTTYAFTDTSLNGRQAIYDAGGTDTLDLSALSRGSVIDLRRGAYSDVAYYSKAQQIDDLSARYGEGFRGNITNWLNDPNQPAYEWTKNVGIAFSTDIENVTGSARVDTITGNGLANLINGRGGADTMRGAGGNDTYSVDTAGDRVYEAAGQGSDRVAASVSYMLATGQSIESMTTTSNAGTAAINLTGNELAQGIRGNAGANVLDGKAGADTLTGLAGNDTYYVDTAGDRVLEAAGQGSDRVVASVSYTLAAGQSIEAMTTTSNAGTAAINLTGNELAQGIRGNAGANVLNGKAGADTLTGLGGADTFVFDIGLGASNIDRLTDFSAAADTIRLDKSIFTVLSLGTLSSSAFKDIAAGAADTTDRILYDSDTGALFYDSNGSASGGRFQFAALDNQAALSAADFVVVA